MIERWIRHEQKRNPSMSMVDIRYRICQQIGYISTALNLLLGLIKIVTGYAIHSISIQADAVNNFSDAINNLGVIFFFHLAQKKPDEKHPYGHQRMESIASLFLGMMILFIGFEIFRESLDRIIHPETILLTWPAVWILILSVTIKGVMAFFYSRSATLLKSSLLQAYGLDARNDALSTGAVLASLLLSRYAGIHLDGWAGIALSLLIFYTAADLIREVISRLLGEAGDPEIIDGIRSMILENRNALNVHDIRVHSYGPSQNYATAHVEVLADQMSLMDAHRMIDRMERKARRDMGVNLVIHIDPVEVHNPRTLAMQERFQKIISTIDERWRMVDFRCDEVKGQTLVIFDLEIPFDQQITEEHAIGLIREHLTADEKYRIILSLFHY